MTTGTQPLPRPVVFVVYAELTSPVVHAQTLPLVAALRDAGNRVDAAAFTSPRRLLLPGVWAAHRRALRELERAAGRAPFRRTHKPRDAGLERLGRELAAALEERGEKDAILFCRQPRAALIGVAAREAAGRAPRVVLDLRGLRDVEYLLTVGRPEAELDGDERGRLEAYRDQEARACRESDAVLCVSRQMVDEVRRRHAVDPARIGHVPNHAPQVPGAEGLRDAARGNLGLPPDALLFAYCGTLAAWQMAEESALLVRALQAARPGTHLLFLTPDAEGARDVIRRVKIADAHVRSVPQQEVPRWLCAADYGLLLRRDDPVNRVACPVKFGEYIAAGVRPVLTPRIGDQSDAALDHDLGVVVGPADVAEAVRRIVLDAARPGTVDVTGREARRAWAASNVAPAIAAGRIAAFLRSAVD